MADEKNINDNEQEEQQKIENPYVNETESKLLEIFTKEFYEYYLKNKDNFKNSSLWEIFYSFINSLSEDSEQKNILNILEKGLNWRQVTINDIKNFYVKWSYTLEWAITKDIFKKFKRKKAVLSVVKTFENKINNLISKYVDNNIISFEEVYGKEIETEDDIDSVFAIVKNKFFELISSIKTNRKYNPKIKSLVDKLRKIKVTNEEIVNQMEKDGIVTEDEKKALMFDTGTWNNNDLNNNDLMDWFDDNVKKELLNIIEVLFNSSVLNTVYDFLSVRDKVSLELEKFKNLSKLGSVLSEYTEDIDSAYIDAIWKTNNTKLPEKYKKDFEMCGKKQWESVKMCEDSVKKNFVSDFLYSNEEIFVEYIKRKNSDLWGILEKLIKNVNLTDDELKKLYGYIKDDYVENAVNFLKKAYSFTKTEKDDYKDILDAFLDPTKNTVKINGTDIEIDKKLALDTSEIKSINDLFEVIPRLRLIIKGDDVNKFVNVFPQYFDTFLVNNEEKNISYFSRVKVRFNGEEHEWYIRKDIDGKVNLYDSSDDLLNNENIKNQIDEKDIEDIEILEDKLELNDVSDIPKLALWLVSTLPWRHQEQAKTINRIENILKEQWDSIKDKFSDEAIEKKEVNAEDFRKEWEKLEGDEQVRFEKWNIIHFRWDNLAVPGLMSNWYYGEIVDINEQAGYFTLKMHGGGILPLNDEWNLVKIPLSAEVLKKIRYAFSSNVFRFKKLDSLEELAEYIKQLNLRSDVYGFKSTLSKWTSNDIKQEGGKLQKKDGNWEFQPIKYIWRDKFKWINTNNSSKNAKSRSDLYDVWEVEYKDDEVVLKDPDGSGFSKTMDLNTFLTVILQNDLSPWTEKEYKTTKSVYDSHVTKPSGKLAFAINDFLLAGKNMKDAFLYHFKQDDELRAAVVYENMTKFIPWVWFLEDIKSESIGQREGVIWKLVQNAKSRLEREWDNTWKNHAKTAAWVIEKEIFSRIKNWEKLSTRRKIKAAWYLLYALDNGPWAYFRDLSGYAGSWMWIKALLWEEHYNKWKMRVEDLQNQLRNDPDNQTLRDDLVLSEMFYIKEADTRKLYSANFSTAVETSWIKAQWDLWKVKNVYESEAGKWNFDLIYQGYKSYIINNRAPNSLWALQALSERTEDYSQYVNYNKAILMTVLTWYMFNFYSTNFREQFDKLCRTYSVPIWLFARQQNGIAKVLRVIDYIVKKKWIEIDNKKQSFTKYIYGTDNPDDINVYDLKDSSKMKKIIWKLEDFWNIYGEEVVSALDYTTSELFEYKKDENIDKKTKDSIWEYFWKVNTKAYGEKFEYASDLFQTSYAPYWQNGILNAHTGVFKKVALHIEHWKFEDNKSAWMWEWLVQKLDSISDFMGEREVYSFILEKFVAWFGDNYRWKNKILLVESLLNWEEENLNKSIKEFLVEAIWWEEWVPPQVEEWLDKFVEIFKTKPKDIKFILEKHFDKNTVIQAQFNSHLLKHSKK